MKLNCKSLGDIGQNCTIGELSKLGISIAFPMSDNLPFDLIAIINGKLFRIQVKSSSIVYNGAIAFEFRTQAKLGQKKRETFTSEDCDAIICYDLVNHKAYLLGPKEFENRAVFNIRLEIPKSNKANHNYNWHEEYLLSPQRIKDVFGIELPNLENVYSNCLKWKMYDLKCQNPKCNKEFQARYKDFKFCSNSCHGEAMRLSKRPSKTEIEARLISLTAEELAKEYKVSPRTIKKWAKTEGLI